MVIEKSYNPFIVIKNEQGFGLIDDGKLKYGTKSRGFHYLETLRNMGYTRIYTSAYIYGMGMLALSDMCNKLKMECIFLIPLNFVLTNVNKVSIEKSISMGSQFIYIGLDKQNNVIGTVPMSSVATKSVKMKRLGIKVKNGKLDRTNISLTAENLSIKYGELATFLPSGISSPGFVNELSMCLREALMNVKQPENIWMACGSGATVEALSKVWPNTVYHCVQVGGDISHLEGKIKNIMIYPSPYKMNTIAKILPNYDTLAHYDAKAWEIMITNVPEEDRQKHVIWNISRDIK